MKLIQLGGHIKGWKTGKKTIQGYAIVDDEDFDWLNQWWWYRDSRGYAARRKGVKPNEKIILMHREIVQTPKGMETDHINRTRLDNRRKNLRVCTTQQNQMNKSIQKNNTSGFTGVSWSKKASKWTATIKLNRKTAYIGQFDNKEDAIKERRVKELELFGEFSSLNKINTPQTEL